MIRFRIVWFGFIFILLHTTSAWAIPAFSQQTGAPCSSCHAASFGPQLTPFGQQFKLLGYTPGRSDQDWTHFSAMMLASYNQTQRGQPGGAAPDFNSNDNTALDQVSLFYGRRLSDHIGTLVQVTYDGVAKHTSWDNLDLRAAGQGSLAGSNLIYGLSLNNNPTVQDVWNSTPAWSYPYVGSALAPTPTAATLIEGGLAQQVLGLTAYTLIDNHWYLEVGGYRNLPNGTLNALGVQPDGLPYLKGVAPYYRAAYQWAWGNDFGSVGIYGLLNAQIYPGGVRNVGTDRYDDYGFDATYQIAPSSDNAWEFIASLVRELQHLPASVALGNANNVSDALTSIHLTANYSYQHTWTGLVSAFDLSGNPDPTLYAPDPIDGSTSGKPDSRGYIFEAAYVPFGKAGSLWAPWINLRVGLQYTLYTHFNGGGVNYDGSGRNASDNNTLYLFLWTIF